MPRNTPKPDRRKHVIIAVVAIVIALVILLIRAETASASVLPHVFQSPSLETLQITGEEYQDAVTRERLMILGMLGLVVLTWFYLRWRPPPERGDESDNARTVDRE
jgi:hypothetical protein